jgi:periplasmic divalent cation tolerance protein
VVGFSLNYQENSFNTEIVKNINKSPIVILSTISTLEDGKLIARGLVEKGLAACVNIVPKMVSIYSWEGKIDEESEHLIIIKSLKINELDIYKEIKTHHPYELPEIISITPSQCDLKYLEWIESVVSGI